MARACLFDGVPGKARVAPLDGEGGVEGESVAAGDTCQDLRSTSCVVVAFRV